MNANPWHDVSYGEDAPNIVNGIIEIPKGSRAKYELDKDSGMIKLDRVLYSSVYYPANYGFIPRTYCDDHDPLDILVICQIDLIPMCLVEAKVIGVMRMIDGGEADDKIVAVLDQDEIYSYNDITECPDRLVNRLKHYFLTYKEIPGSKTPKCEITHVYGAEEAKEVIRRSIEDYKKHIKKTTKAGSLMSRQAHMELILQNQLRFHLGTLV